MDRVYGSDRRTFLKLSGAAAMAAGFGCFSLRARAGLTPGSICVAHLTDTRFSVKQESKRSQKTHPGRLYAESFALADDLMSRFVEDPLKPVSLVVHGGNLTRSGKFEQCQAAKDWLTRQQLPIRLTRSKRDSKTEISMFSDYGFYSGRPYYSYDSDGFHFAHLAAEKDDTAQQAWLADDLAGNKQAPTILVLPDQPDDKVLRGLLDSTPQVVLVLCGGTLDNRAKVISNALVLSTASAVTYPCGSRTVELSVTQDGKVGIQTDFLQTRLLDLVEESFYQLRSPKYVKRLGRRIDRNLTVVPGSLSIKPDSFSVNPSLAPRWDSSDRLTLALMSDTHLCLDKYVSQEGREEYELIGHFSEQGSKAIYNDILEQIAEGRHRVEFFDEVYAKSPESDAHFLERKVDALLIDGDLAEHGKRDEARLVLDGLSRLPERLRERAVVAAGNHDLYKGEFSPNGTASKQDRIAELYDGYGFSEGKTDYTVQLSEWLTLIVLDSVIPTHANLGLLQDQIDWLEDQVRQRKDQALLIACHHPLYPITLVPPLMQAYLRARSHFTPRMTAARVQLHKLFAEHANVKLVISGHYHGVCVDQHKKQGAVGGLADDRYTTHIQVPCTIEYPNAYRLLDIQRSGQGCTVDYVTAYTRETGLRAESSAATLFKLLGTGVKVPKKYEGTLARLSQQDNLLGDLAKMNPYDLTDLNVRGFKDGTANRGRGNSGKNNINGRLEFTL